MAMDALMIGVSGMRGTIGGTLDPFTVMRMACAFACWLKQTTPDAERRALKVVVGRDSRPSGPFVAGSVIAALSASGIEVIDLDVVTTPGVAMMVKHLQADAGVVVTASHNPIEWNGLKFLNAHGIAPPPEDAARIRQLFDEHAKAFVTVDRIIPPRRNSETHALHTKRILDHVDVLGISTRRFKVVLDSVNGAGCVATATLLSKLGVQLAHINATPDGRFPHPPEPTRENLVQLCEEVKRQRAHVGFAQDPDADRLAIVDENGRYIGEEYSLVLCAQWLLSKRPGGAVSNLSTSRMLDDVAKRYNSTVIRTPVGEANVIAAMVRENAIVGGEGNGGVIDPRIVPGRDSLVGIAYVLQLMSATGKTVSQLVADLPRYEIVKTKFPCRREDADRAVSAVREAFANEKIDTQDGVRIDFSDGWVHARPSNTEPIMRIIAEARDQSAANELIARVESVVRKALA
jgi:phosphomannomutase